MQSSHDKPVSSNGEAAELAKRITGALSMIIVGIIFLLNTTGALSWSFWWELLKFWPAFIITAGIGIMLSFNATSKVFGEIINFMIFLLLVFFAAINTNSGIFQGTNYPSIHGTGFSFSGYGSDNSLLQQTETIKKDEYSGNGALNYNLDQKTGQLAINSTTTDNSLLQVALFSDNGHDAFGIKKELNTDGLTVTVDMNQKINGFGFTNNGYSTTTNINPDWKKVNLNAKLGAGKTSLNFDEGLKTSYAYVDVGVGETAVNMTTGSVPESIKLHTGIGSIRINLPKEVGYDIIYSVGIGSVKLEGGKNSGGLGLKDTFKSENFASAGSKIYIEADLGIGELVVTQN